MTFVVGGALVVGVVTLDRLANRVVRPIPRPPERTVPELGVRHEDFFIDGGTHRLAAWLLLAEREPADRAASLVTVATAERGGRSPERRPLILLAHGWGASYGTVLRLGEPLVRAGHDVLLFDVRGHGRSEPAPYVTVRCFRDDAIAVASHAAARFPGRPLVLVGHSMGGAAGVLAAADGAPIDGLVLVAAPADVIQVTAEFLIDKGMPGNLLVNLFRPFWWRRVGGTFLSLTPSRRIGELDIPIVMIQPENDQRVHRRHAERLSAAAGIDYHLVEGCEHTDVLESPETLRLVTQLVERLASGVRVGGSGG